jgi:gluconokinase
MSMAASLPAFSGGPAPAAVVVMGVCGAGKTTVGLRLAAALGATFVDGDDLHSPAARAKMAASIALDDADRWAWLDRVGQQLAAGVAQGEGTVIACSALRRAYRDRLRAAAGPALRLIYLQAELDGVRARIAARTGHVVPASLVESQFALLEPPYAEPDVISMPFDADLSRALPVLAARLTRPPIGRIEW